MKYRVVIVGGGTGETILAILLAGKLQRDIVSKKVELILLSDSLMHYYKPAFMYVAFNLFLKQELERPQKILLRPEIVFIIDRSEGFDLNKLSLPAKVKNTVMIF
ncbi:pyridine nucleotide-disulfide oxidoreductase [Yersinia entomophaga]|uniref:Pyridine nucleotide-disulfide oxidoreductase n=1 Tax=Yersinia entomophaga TaxID=935293 RepID=A0ABM6BN69_YERET|nr:pyridine nucleotide-disulfide oxidoreductase [Yersinia entomophaga]